MIFPGLPTFTKPIFKNPKIDHTLFDEILVVFKIQKMHTQNPRHANKDCLLAW